MSRAIGTATSLRKELQVSGLKFEVGGRCVGRNLLQAGGRWRLRMLKEERGALSFMRSAAGSEARARAL